MTTTRKPRQGRAANSTLTDVQLRSHNVDTSLLPTRLLPRARTEVGPPCAGRRLTYASVGQCPITGCAAFHIHRIRDLTALLRRRVVRVCPVTHERYLLVPIRHRKPKSGGAQ